MLDQNWAYPLAARKGVLSPGEIMTATDIWTYDIKAGIDNRQGNELFHNDRSQGFTEVTAEFRVKRSLKSALDD